MIWFAVTQSRFSIVKELWFLACLWLCVFLFVALSVWLQFLSHLWQMQSFGNRISLAFQIAIQFAQIAKLLIASADPGTFVWGPRPVRARLGSVEAANGNLLRLKFDLNSMLTLLGILARSVSVEAANGIC